MNEKCELQMKKTDKRLKEGYSNMSNRWRGRVNSRGEKGRKCLGIWGKRLQGRTKDKRKQGKFVSYGTSFHISPTADVSLVSSAFVLFWVTAETQRSGEKAKRAMLTA